jgi:nucleotide-binding universal stress UspA family protein
MVGDGVAEERIEFKSQLRIRGVAKDILQACSAGLFDAVIMGRRGLSGLQGMLAGSVSSSLVNSAVDTPVWLVDEEGPSPDIMVAVDGSKHSFNAVDHLAFIIGGNTDVKITLFHLSPRLKDVFPADIEDEDIDSKVLEELILKGDKERIDKFYARAKKRFTEAGIQKSQIDFVTKKGTKRVGKIGKSVLDEYRKGKFGTLVVGRRGVNKKLFTGTVSTYLVNQFTAGALWVVA